jgi:nitrite reductase/ring-hydroxylating ferredoxin subunit
VALHGHRLVLDRRRFLSISSGCVLGALGGTTSEAADKAATVDIGKLADFSEDGISEAFVKHDFFVIRNEGRLFAVSTTCPHKGNVLHKDPEDSSRIVCEGHGSTFNASGKVAVGPASTGLVRLGISVNGEGHVIVNPTEEFPEDNWTDRQSSIEVK